MTTTLTADVNATLQQIAELTAAGCDIVRVACPKPGRRRRAARDRPQEPDPGDRRHPLPAEVRLRRDRGGLRGGAGEPGQHPQVRRPGQGDRRPRRRTTARPSGSGSTPGSLDKRLLEKYGKATPEALVESAPWEASLFEEHGFHDIKISVKHNDPVVMVRAYELLAEACDYPLHLGVTEAGPAFQGTIKSAVAFGALLAPGHRRHDPGVALGAAGRGGQGRHPDPAVAQPARRASWRSSPARPAGVPRSTSTSSPSEVTAGLEGWRSRCGSPSWAASSTVRARPARPTSAWRPATARGRSSSGARSSRPSRGAIVETLIEEAMKIAEAMEPSGEEPVVTVG